MPNFRVGVPGQISSDTESSNPGSFDRVDSKEHSFSSADGFEKDSRSVTPGLTPAISTPAANASNPSLPSLEAVRSPSPEETLPQELRQAVKAWRFKSFNLDMSNTDSLRALETKSKFNPDVLEAYLDMLVHLTGLPNKEINSGLRSGKRTFSNPATGFKWELAKDNICLLKGTHANGETHINLKNGEINTVMRGEDGSLKSERANLFGIS